MNQVKLRTAVCRFNEGDQKVYSYLTDQEVQVGDSALVIVDSNAFRGGRTLKVVEVVSVRAGIDHKATKFLVSVINLEAYEANIVRLNRIREVQERLQQLEAEQAEQDRWRKLAENAGEGSEAAKLFEELQGLQSGMLKIEANAKTAETAEVAASTETDAKTA